MARKGPTIAEIALGLIQAAGPQQLDALVAGVVAADGTRAKDPRRAVRAAIDGSYEFLEAWDGRWCSIVDQLDGAMFTTRVSTLERGDGIVVMRDHLALVEQLARRPRPAPGGGDVHLHTFGDYFELPWPDDEDDDGTMREALGSDLADQLLGFLIELGLPADADEDETLREFCWEMALVRLLDGPPGWFPTLSTGQLLGIRIRSRAVEAVPVNRRDVAGPHVGIVGTQVASLARLVIGPNASWFGAPVISIEELLELVATEKPELLRRPLPPFPEVLARGGLELHDGLVGHRGTDWTAIDRLTEPSPEEAWGFTPSRLEH